ncbi:hypothetical protein [Paracoccus sp. SSK6]|uniref:hypothetical protein n=1 Tax=Paracoccus sp. SSK6 TaxID=3143131 RepID=UPI0032190B74
MDLTDEGSIAQAAQRVAGLGTPGLVIIATGFLHGPGIEPEKILQALDPAAMAASLAVNAIGPALILRHVLPLLPRDRPSVAAVPSARSAASGTTGWGAGIPIAPRKPH